MNIAVCDDDNISRKLISLLLDEYISSTEQEISYSVYTHGEDLMDDALKIGGFDIYILDVMMPELNGIELGLALRKASYEGKILYLTSSEDYALDAFKAKAFNYIVKPIKKETFFYALDEVIATIPASTEKSLIVKTRDGSIKLSFDSILYADLNKRAITYHLVNNKVIEGTTIRVTFSEAVQELLQDDRFVLCGVSMVVNLALINMIENEAILFRGGYKTYIGKRICRDLKASWMDYWTGREQQ